MCWREALEEESAERRLARGGQYPPLPHQKGKAPPTHTQDRQLFVLTSARQGFLPSLFLSFPLCILIIYANRFQCDILTSVSGNVNTRRKFSWSFHDFVFCFSFFLSVLTNVSHGASELPGPGELRVVKFMVSERAAETTNAGHWGLLKPTYVLHHSVYQPSSTGSLRAVIPPLKGLWWVLSIYNPLRMNRDISSICALIILPRRIHQRII